MRRPSSRWDSTFGHKTAPKPSSGGKSCFPILTLTVMLLTRDQVGSTQPENKRVAFGRPSMATAATSPPSAVFTESTQASHRVWTEAAGRSHTELCQAPCRVAELQQHMRNMTGSGSAFGGLWSKVKSAVGATSDSFVRKQLCPAAIAVQLRSVVVPTTLKACEGNG